MQRLVPSLVFLIIISASTALGDDDPAHSPSVYLYTNVPYAGDGSERRWLADVAVAQPDADADETTAETALKPMVIYVHGGGWSAGRKDYTRWNTGVRWADRNGFIYVRINYRLSQHAAFPAQVHDVMNAVRYFRLHAEEFGGDPDKIVLTGDSAGAHVAVLAALAANDGAFEEGSLYPEVSAEVSAVAGLAGPYDLAEMIEQHEETITNLLGGPDHVTAESLAAASPATYLDADDPPILLLHSERDPIVPLSESIRLFEAAQAAGAIAHFIPVDSDEHAVPTPPAHWEQVVWFREHTAE